ncbi:hypothetical protein EUX98_g4053 [Antrodiella citrinella]|uniref:Cytochrome P450 n=1 Tax=Antrodiella citrinella TaxID=2447956 RepID=A0A4S4MXF2_9APHY|nr:hypothetical protein EUX98_g4053 [Antrodiella citrinella]
MQYLTVLNALVVQAAIGLVSHTIFKVYEPFRLLPVAILVFVVPAILSILLLAHFSVLYSLLISFVSYYTTLLTSIVIYRLGPFHPLAKYPGPLLCKLSMIHMAIVTFGGSRHEYIRKLHEQDGDIVRIGPNEVSIRDVSAVAPLMGASGMPKGPMWVGRCLLIPELPLIAQQDSAEHLHRRKPWNRAFNTEALKAYEPVVAERVTQFVHILKGKIGVADLAQVLNAFSFDVTSDTSFGGGSNMLRDGDVEKFRSLMDAAMRMSVIFENLPWLQSMNRQNNEDGADLAFHVVLDDAVLAVIAGSESTASAMSNALFFVMRDPDVYTKLKAEVDMHYPQGTNACDTRHYGKMVYLDAVLNEAMRLYPPDLSGSQRALMRGTGGKYVGPYFIPEGTAARVHSFSLGRDPRHFSPLPDTFWPDRWLLADSDDAEKNADFIHDTNAFLPFSFGPASCVGKDLAMMTMRMLLCSCVQQLELTLAGHLVDDPGRWERELKDYFILDKGKLPVVVKSR